MRNKYSELFLEDFIKIKKDTTIFLPVGTLEWHDAHLPLGTDLIIAKEIAKLINKKVKGLILPPLFIGTDRSKLKKGKLLVGMDRYLNKKLAGSIYYLHPNFFFKLLENIINQLERQGFRKLIIITGHGGSKQIEILEKIKNKFSRRKIKIRIISPWRIIKQKYGQIQHAGIEETSILWALRPDLIKKSQKAKLEKDGIITLLGSDPRLKASLKFGKEILNFVIKKL